MDGVRAVDFETRKAASHTS